MILSTDVLKPVTKVVDVSAVKVALAVSKADSASAVIVASPFVVLTCDFGVPAEAETLTVVVIVALLLGVCFTVVVTAVVVPCNVVEESKAVVKSALVVVLE